MTKIPGFLLASAFVLSLSTGCSISDRQMAKMTVAESKTPEEVLQAAEAVLRERYYQVKVYRSTGHIQVLTPVRLEGNDNARKKIDVYVFLENGYYMPKVTVRDFVDMAEPPHQTGLIAGRFPIEFRGVPGTGPAPEENWTPLQYDHTEEMAIRKAIYDRLKIPA